MLLFLRCVNDANGVAESQLFESGGARGHNGQQSRGGHFFDVIGSQLQHTQLCRKPQMAPGEYRCECISTVFIASLRIRSGRLRLPLSQLRTQPRLLPLSPRSSPSPFLMVAGPVAALLLSSSLSLFL